MPLALLSALADYQRQGLIKLQLCNLHLSAPLKFASSEFSQFVITSSTRRPTALQALI